MQKSEIIALFTQAPASLVWSEADGRAIGTSEGFVLDIWSDRAEAAALFPPDRADVARRNGVLLQLLLAALRPDWAGSETWLAQQMRLAARTATPFEAPNITRRVRFRWDRTRSRATLVVRL